MKTNFIYKLYNLQIIQIIIDYQTDSLSYKHSIYCLIYLNIWTYIIFTGAFQKKGPTFKNILFDGIFPFRQSIFYQNFIKETAHKMEE